MTAQTRSPAALRELGTVYEQVRARIVELVGGLGPGEASTAVPACASWSVHDLLAHLAGNCTDIMTGNLEGAGTDAWTARQVDARRSWTLERILTEWDEAGPRVAAIADDFPGRVGRQFIADVTVHEHDIRGALGRPGAWDSKAVGIALDFLVTVFLRPAATALGLGPLEVRADAKTWVAGSGGLRAGDPDGAIREALFALDDAPARAVAPVGTLTAEPFELFRAVTGRRSADQIRRFEWTLDPEPYLPLFGLGPFTVRSRDLDE